MSAPIVQTLPTPPNRGTDTQSQFDTKADAFLTALPNFGNQQNTLATWMNSTGNTINQRAVQTATDSVAAQQAGQAAVSVANFKGAWSGLTGALAVPATVLHNGNYWALLSATGNVALIEPGVSTQWSLVPVVGYNNFIRAIEAKATFIADFVRNEFKVWEAPYGQEPKTITQALTTTRASTGTVNTPFGVQTRGANIARAEYDPSTGEPFGLLCEEQRTNLLLHSNDFTQSVWVKESSSTITASAIDSPLGALTGSAHVAGGAGNYTMRQTIASASGTYSSSFYLKADEITEALVQFNDVNNASVAALVRVNLLNGDVLGSSIVSPFDNLQFGVVPHVGGWYRVFVSASGVIASSGYVARVQGRGATAAGQKYYVAGAQFEAGAFPASYIPTGGSQVTRVAESQKVNTTLNPNEGTFFVQVSGMENSARRGVIGSRNSDNTQPFGLTKRVTANVYRLSAQDAEGATIEGSNVTLPKEPFVAGVTYDSDGMKLFVNGEFKTALSGAFVYGVDASTIEILGSTYAGGTDPQLAATVGFVKYIPRVLSDAELIALTSGV